MLLLLFLKDSLKLSLLKLIASWNEPVLRSSELRMSAELNSRIGDIDRLMCFSDCFTSKGKEILDSVLSVVVDDDGDAGGEINLFES